MTASQLSIQHLKKTFKKRTVVRDVSLEIASGEVVGLLGPNETGEVTFQAPTEPGEYPFLCTFPAHCSIGMKGVLIVKK